MTKSRPTQAERTAKTKAALLGAARELFAERGFAQTGREEIAARAGVTRGALYHHFSSKNDVAAAVLSKIEAELVDRVIVASAAGRTAVEQLTLSCRAYIEACADPSTARILADAPSVLGVDACRTLSAETCVRLLGVALARAADEGVEVPGDPRVAASLLLGMLNEAAALVCVAPKSKATRQRVNGTVDAFLAALLVAHPR